MTDLARREADVLLYQTEDGQTRVEVRFDGDTAWLSLGQIAELFQRDTTWAPKSSKRSTASSRPTSSSPSCRR